MIHLHAIFAMFDAQKMRMVTSDHPHWEGDTPDFTARFLLKALRIAVMGENARQLYKLPAAATSAEPVAATPEAVYACQRRKV